MKTKEIYIAEDGSRFDDRFACQKYEAECAQIALAVSLLNPRPERTDFSNGSGFIRQPSFPQVRTMLLRIGNQIMPHPWLEQCLADPNKHISWPARIVGDSNHKALNDAFYRLKCTADGKEYGQPYFTTHPEDATTDLTPR